jgi:hypothetical protein
MILFLLAWLFMGLISHLLNEFCHKACGFHQEFDSFGDVAVVALGPICGIVAIVAMVVPVTVAKIKKRLGK